MTGNGLARASFEPSASSPNRQRTGLKTPSEQLLTYATLRTPTAAGQFSLDENATNDLGSVGGSLPMLSKTRVAHPPASSSGRGDRRLSR